MKKLLCSVVVLLLSVSALSAEEKVIDQNLLPKNAQSFIASNYSSDKVSVATVERGLFDKDYKVILTSGVKIEFDGDGDWSDIECKRNSEVPMSIIPANVASYIQDRFPDNKVVKVERDNKTIEVELDNDVELKFNNKGNLIGFDS